MNTITKSEGLDQQPHVAPTGLSYLWAGASTAFGHQLKTLGDR